MGATVYSISWAWWEQSLLPAFEAAREEGSLEPLRPVVPEPLLDPAKHILTGRRFLLFGPTEHRLMNMAPLLLGAVREAATDETELGDAAFELAEQLLAGGGSGAAGLALMNALEADAHLPEWLGTGRGPGLLSPTRGEELVHLLTPCQSGEALAAHPPLLQTLSALVGILEAADATCWVARRVL